MSRSIFLSYSRHDASGVETLVTDLERAGHHVWLDRQLSGGQEWWDTLLERIRLADVFLLAVSEDSLVSIPCRREREYATALGKPVLPVIVAGDASPKLAPPELARTQWVDYRSYDKDAAFELIRALAELPAAPPLPEELPPVPEVPVSYLTSIANLIDRAEPLTEEQQLSIIFKLRDGLDDKDDRKESLELLARMRGRSELLARAADEIDKLLADPTFTAPILEPEPAVPREPEQPLVAEPAPPQPKRSSTALIAGALVIAAAAVGVGVVMANMDDGTADPIGAVSPTITTTTAAPAPTTLATTAPPPSAANVDSGDVSSDGLDEAAFQQALDALLAANLGQSGAVADLGCFADVSNYASVNGFASYFNAGFVWYSDWIEGAWLREDGAAFFPATGLWQSFCTGRYWNPLTGLWG